MALDTGCTMTSHPLQNLHPHTAPIPSSPLPHKGWPVTTSHTPCLVPCFFFNDLLLTSPPAPPQPAVARDNVRDKVIYS